jgi:hypothetical protein
LSYTSSTFRTKVKEILESFSTLNALAVVSHVYAYFMQSCGRGKRREIMKLMSVETVIGFLVA